MSPRQPCPGARGQKSHLRVACGAQQSMAGGGGRKAGMRAAASGHTPGGDPAQFLGRLWALLTLFTLGMSGWGNTSNAFSIHSIILIAYWVNVYTRRVKRKAQGHGS